MKDAWAPRANYRENNLMNMLVKIIFCGSEQKEPRATNDATFRLTVEGFNRLRHANFHEGKLYNFFFIKFNCLDQTFTNVRFPLHYRISQELTSKTSRELDTNCRAQ